MLYKAVPHIALRGPLPRTRVLVSALAMLAASVAGCGGRPSPTEPSAISPAAQAYLDELIGKMQANSINRLKIDWKAFRTSVMEAAGHAQTVGAPRIMSCNAPAVETPALPATIGYVNVRGFTGTPEEATAFANGIQRAIADADRDGLDGWVVDLRGNGGGNMWPMIAGLGPILGEGVAGYFIDPLGSEIPWTYREGASWEGASEAQRVDAPYHLRRQAPRVAVLFNAGTASSGEAAVIAFLRRPDSRTFGASATCGLSTANELYTMSDGASLYLTVAVMADRAKTPYGGPIGPDEWVMDPREVDQRAVAWLRSNAS
jgi:carboxyl-terminal processing protease